MINKIDLNKIQVEEGFDTFDLLRNGSDFDNQKVSAVIKYLVDRTNALIDINKDLQDQLINLQAIKKRSKKAR